MMTWREMSLIFSDFAADYSRELSLCTAVPSVSGMNSSRSESPHSVVLTFSLHIADCFLP